MPPCAPQPHVLRDLIPLGHRRAARRRRAAPRLVAHPKRRRLATAGALVAAVVVALLGPATAPAEPPTHTAFETVAVRPLALSEDGRTLFAVNTPDGRLEILDVVRGGLVPRASVAVGLEPVAVAVQDATTVWVVNHLSDSVSIVTLDGAPRVARTIQVGDEPWDLVFAGEGRRRAFVATAHRGQNAPWVKGDSTTPGVGRADVWVFDVAAAGSGATASPETIVTLFGDKPRALAVSPDGETVYAAVFHSGNQTTILHEDLVCDGGASAAPCDVLGSTMPGGLPAPNESHEGIPAPEVGLIVGFDEPTGRWVDELDRDWSPGIRLELPDLDVFEIDAEADPPVEKAAHAHVGTLLFNMAVNPATGALYVSNTEARNRVRFEGRGVWARTAKPVGEPASVRGHIAESRITVVRDGVVTPRHLNKHIDYDADPVPAGTRERSLATPLGMAVSGDGGTLYLAAFGSSKIGVFDTEALETDAFVPSADDHIEVSGGGPAGLVLDETRGRLYVATRFDGGIAVVDVATGAEISKVRLHNPELPVVVAGRPFLYDARLTSSNGEASCAACHVFGDVDDLAWDLGDPDGFEIENRNPGQPLTNLVPFHPMKGPMTTQSLRGLADSGPMHWRGDRSGANAEPPGDALDADLAFKAFNGAFEGLLGRDEGPLDDAQMQAFTDFALALAYPPNPHAELDGSRTPLEAEGETLFSINRREGEICRFGPCNVRCVLCHRLSPEEGLFGTSRESAFTEQSQVFKIPHLRNVYQKVGMFGLAATEMFGADSGPMGPQVRGFGLIHDGSADGVRSFLRFFDDLEAGEREALEAFVLAFPSALAPVVGQQVTLDPFSTPADHARARLLVTQAHAVHPRPDAFDAPACALVARRADALGATGYVHDAAGWLVPDDGSDPITPTELLFASRVPGTKVTLTCVPPGSAVRAGVDRDLDGVFDGLDDCPAVANPGQSDLDGDGVGDACDRCPGAFDPAQGDADADGVGDACDAVCANGLDDDGDGLFDVGDDPACSDAAGATELPRNDVRIRVWPLDIVLGDPAAGLSLPLLVVAVLADAGVDPASVDPASLRLGPGGATASGITGGGGSIASYDVDGDGAEDLLLRFDADEASLEPGDVPACLVGEIDGVAFESCAVPEPQLCGRGGELALLAPVAVVLTRRARRSARARDAAA